MLRQRTLKNEINASGVGVHTGDKVYLTLRPAPVNTGIVFRRVDLEQPVAIPAKHDYVGDTTLSTCLVKDNVRVATIEHLMSAFAGMGVDNAYVDLTASEVPIMDGSASPFVFLIQSADIFEQNAPKRFVKIKKPIITKCGDKQVTIKPHRGFKVKFTVNFEHPLFPKQGQSATLDFSSTSFIKEVSRARTFGFVSEFEQLRQSNLALGASLDNAIALDDYRVVNQDGLRYEDECVRHKILDVIGDLYLLGCGVIGAFEGHKSGHALNNRLLRDLYRDDNAWEMVTFEEADKSPIAFTPLYDEIKSASVMT
jgi:UDP-3-O-[3-hydroxymyristoyl] N-acetylglucosamine deacetylase